MSETLDSVSRRKVLTLVAAAFGAATMSQVFVTSEAEAQTAGMERRQERRTGRHERRETRRTGRQERRETRRGGGSDTTTTGTAK
ncbi:Ni/Co efflux regulator RcnB [Bradyrhizobium sp. USDA 4454]